VGNAGAQVDGNDIRVAAKKWPTGKRAVLAADLAAGRILVERPTIIQAAAFVRVGIGSVRAVLKNTDDERRDIAAGRRAIRARHVAKRLTWWSKMTTEERRQFVHDHEAEIYAAI
jgi:hypothetical protein